MTCATCLTCKHWQPKANPEMTRCGFAPCALGPQYRFLPMQAACARHAPADAQVSDARIQWAESLRARRVNGG